MSGHRKWAEISAKSEERRRNDPASQQRYDAARRAMDVAVRLAELRERERRPQHEQARILGVTQARVSQIENAPDLYLSTLTQYVATLGGTLRLMVDFDDESVELVLPEGSLVEHEVAGRAAGYPR